MAIGGAFRFCRADHPSWWIEPQTRLASRCPEPGEHARRSRRRPSPQRPHERDRAREYGWRFGPLRSRNTPAARSSERFPWGLRRLRVLVLKRLQPLRLGNVHAPELALPSAEGRSGDPMPATRIDRCGAGLRLAQNVGDLSFVERRWSHGPILLMASPPASNEGAIRGHGAARPRAEVKQSGPPRHHPSPRQYRPDESSPPRGAHTVSWRRPGDGLMPRRAEPAVSGSVWRSSTKMSRTRSPDYLQNISMAQNL